eukprot:TRINITY_DN20239_c0_g1_i1.p1 TRINITY_DN20239_c0_g1~~TRINITY_DN20239_c0_g1_i1.p1  ORF type:complete len:631 (-),score=98.52 TRINITY_DN20239_c0_g1_i1:22-1914(-)
MSLWTCTCCFLSFALALAEEAAVLLPDLVDGSTCDVPRVDGTRLTQEEFNAKWRGKLVIITGLVQDWMAWRSWRGDGFVRKFGRFNITRDDVNKRVLGDDADGSWRNASRSVAEALGSSGVSKRRSLWLVQPPHPLSQAVLEDFAIPLSLKGVRLTGPFVSIGQSGHGGQFNNHPENWLAQIRGRKRWMLLPPKAKLPSYTRHAHPCNFPSHHVADETTPKLLQCVVKAGEIIYLGDNWHHATCNVDGNGSLNVALGYIGKVDHLPRAFQAAIDGDLSSLATSEAGELKAVDSEGKSTLFWAATAGHLAIVKSLVQKGINPCALCNAGTQAAHWAAGYGHDDVLKYLAGRKRCPEVLNHVDREGLSPLGWAAKLGRWRAVAWLLSRSSYVDMRDHRGNTAAHLAARYGHDTVLDVLLKSGASLNARATDGATPLHWAAKYGELITIDLLLGKRASVEASAKGGVKPLHWAARYGQAGAVVKLVSKWGARFNDADDNGARPLDWAARLGHAATVESLVDLRAKLALAPGEKKAQAIHWAAMEGHVQVLQALAKADQAALDAGDERGMRPLHYAASKGHVSAVESLLALGANPNARTHSGGLPFDLAAASGFASKLSASFGPDRLKQARLDL